MINEAITSEYTATKLCVTQAGMDQVFLVASVRGPAGPLHATRESYTRIAEVLGKQNLKIVHERIFGSLSVKHEVMSARKQAFCACGVSPERSVTYIEGKPTWGEGFAGIIIRAVSAEKVWTIRDRDIPCGQGWILNGITYMALQDIRASFNNSLKTERKQGQARLMIERAEKILRENGASYGDVVRTWFYLSDILGWYAAFNKVRNEKYGEFGIMPGPEDIKLFLPASTGIQGESPSGGACTMDLIAVLKSEQCTRKLSNPTQLDAFRYGSAFVRASVVKNGDADIIYVSGTAAIDEHGVSLYPGNIRAQIDCTFDKVQTLLEQEGAKLQDICAATVFVKQPQFSEIFYERASARGLDDFPCVCIVADVCRDELLFEMDAEAVAKTG